MSQENVDRYALAARVHALLEPELALEGWQLVDVRVFRGGGRLQVRLYVDLPGEQRIDLDGCAQASRSASMHLEEVDLFPGAWVLEVSSPGIRRPLRTEAHFAAVVGRDITLKWRPRAGGDAQNLRGRLVDVADGTLLVEPAGSSPEGDEDVAPTPVPVGAVLEANLDHEFDAQAVIREDRRQRKQARRAERAERRQRRQKRPRPRAGDADRQPADSDERDG